MARIVDLAPFIGQYEFVAADQSAHLSIQVIDSFAPWNAGTWIWTIDRNGTANLEPCGSDGSEVPDIGCDIQTLTAMLFGYKRPGELLACGRLSATPETVWKLERSIPRKATYFSDFF
jgi:predicted acetyltransferase